MKPLNRRLDLFIKCTDGAPRRPLRAPLISGVLAAILIVLVPYKPALAEESSTSESFCSSLQSESEIAPEPEMIEWNGIPGMFFPMATARLILCEVRELRLRRAETAVGGRLIESWELQVEFTERQLELSQQAREEYEQIVEIAVGQAREAEDRIDVWYRSPVFLISLGVVMTVGLYVAVSYGLQALNP